MRYVQSAVVLFSFIGFVSSAFGAEKKDCKQLTKEASDAVGEVIQHDNKRIPVTPTTPEQRKAAADACTKFMEANCTGKMTYQGKKFDLLPLCKNSLPLWQGQTAPANGQ